VVVFNVRRKESNANCHLSAGLVLANNKISFQPVKEKKAIYYDHQKIFKKEKY